MRDRKKKRETGNDKVKERSTDYEREKDRGEKGESEDHRHTLTVKNSPAISGHQGNL